MRDTVYVLLWIRETSRRKPTPLFWEILFTGVHTFDVDVWSCLAGVVPSPAQHLGRGRKISKIYRHMSDGSAEMVLPLGCG